MLIGMSTISGIKYEIDQKYVRPTQVPRLICDMSNFVSTTNWTPTISFEKILTDTLDYWRKEITMNPKR